MLSLSRAKYLPTLPYNILIVLQFMVYCSALIFVHQANELFNLSFTLFKVFLSKFKPNKSVAKTRVCIVKLDHEFRVFQLIIEVLVRDVGFPT